MIVQKGEKPELSACEVARFLVRRARLMREKDPKAAMAMNRSALALWKQSEDDRLATIAELSQ